MRVPSDRRVHPPELKRSAPPGASAGRVEPAPPVDGSTLSTLDPAPPRSRKPLLAALAWTALAGARLIGTLGGGPTPPAIACATLNDAPRLEQVLSCEGVTSPAQLKASIHQANYAWEGLRGHFSGGLESLRDRPGAAGRITVWPYGQVMAAALDQARVTGDYNDFEQLVNGLEQYRHPEGGYASSRGPFGLLGNRFYDDNAWLGLVFVQAAQQVPQGGYLEKAEEVAAFLRSAQQPDGGLLWEEGNPNPSYNTCVLGPTIELSLRLYQQTGDSRHLDFARQLTELMDSRLRQPDGLYADNVNLESGRVDPTVWSYNQGTPVGAHLLWYRLTGDPSHLEKAQQTARAALHHFSDDVLWRQPPAFNAVFFRNLLQLEDPAAEQALDGYLERAWSQALEPSSGLFNRSGNGLGSYEGHGQLSTIDQAGLVQLYALRDWPDSQRHQIS
ncbi:MAG: glycoside hydrolase family 76 protein [Vulcanimicrobiota bacterium]